MPERTRSKSNTMLSFGSSFTEHMLVAEYKQGEGWGEYRIEAYAPFSLDPAAAVFHYGQAIFDGLKAFRGSDGRVRLFRPRMHVARLNASARRMCMPELDPDALVSAIVEFTKCERQAVPARDGASLYLRPAMIASEPFLGVRPARSYLFFMIASPNSGPYYGRGEPLRIQVEDRYSRAAPGGVGAAKTGGNYAASLLAAEEAQRSGFHQVLWLDAADRTYLEEVGTMNIMLRLAGEVVTPALVGTILPGVMRDSALTLLREWGIRTSEGPISISDVLDANRSSNLSEVWGTGTAAGIVPIGELSYKGQRIVVNGGAQGEIAERLGKAIADIQYGRAPDHYGWTTTV